jgi:hypothetical protein
MENKQNKIEHNKKSRMQVLLESDEEFSQSDEEFNQNDGCLSFINHLSMKLRI